jgi:hypothetical protein
MTDENKEQLELKRYRVSFHEMLPKPYMEIVAAKDFDDAINKVKAAHLDSPKIIQIIGVHEIENDFDGKPFKAQLKEEIIE